MINKKTEDTSAHVPDTDELPNLERETLGLDVRARGSATVRPEAQSAIDAVRDGLKKLLS